MCIIVKVLLFTSSVCYISRWLFYFCHISLGKKHIYNKLIFNWEVNSCTISVLYNILSHFSLSSEKGLL